MKADDWNKKFFEDRMARFNTDKETPAFAGVSWRSVPGTNNTRQVSLCGRQRPSDLGTILYSPKRLKSLKSCKAASEEDMLATFPLAKEGLCGNQRTEQL